MNKPDAGPIQPIPGHAKVVFQGVLFDVHQWEQEMYNGSTKTFEKLTRRDTATVVAATSDGKIIMTRQKQPGMKALTGLPGGKVDTGEEPLAAAKRELLEETGYTAEGWTPWLTLHPHEKINYAAHSYLAKNARKVREAEPDEGEKIELILQTFDEFMELMYSETFRDDEVALAILRAKADPAKITELKTSLGLK
jgi:ADP-ribose pyrophosphatase